MAAAWRALSTPVEIGDRRFPAPGLVAAAAVGAALMAIVAFNRWGGLQDEHAYWLAARRLIDAQPLYDPAVTSVTSYAYWYPPAFAQALAPAAALLDAHAFSWAWTALLLGCLWWLGGRSPLGGLALVAFFPVAVELWFRNVHLVLAVVVAAGILGRSWCFTIGAAIKGAPGLGVLYLLVRGRWRDAAVATGVGVVIMITSLVLSPDAWRQYVAVLSGRGAEDISGFLAIPFGARVAAAVILTIVAARLRPSLGEPLLVLAIVAGSPTVWVDALAGLVAIVPILRARRADDGARRSQRQTHIAPSSAA